MKKHIVSYLFSGLLVLVVLTFVVSGLLSADEEAALSDKLIRLHVLANSDSEQDQALKLAVKDDVLDIVTDLTENAGDTAQAEQILLENLTQIQERTNSALSREGSDYSAKVSLETYDFPTKSYGLFSLPAGTYKALRVEIGEGEGQNWWCVLFPPLCNAATSEEFTETAKKAGLTQEELRFMTKSGEKYIFKFRLAELFVYVKALFS